MALNISILAPDRIVFNGNAEEIILPTNTGQMGVLSNHTPLITGLDIGVMLMRAEKTSSSSTASPSSQGWSSFAIMGGFALIKDNKITILVNDAELGSSINAAEAEKRLNEAQAALEKAALAGRKEKIEASLVFKRARARMQVVAQK